ncbi:MAG: IscS subfamily cysteine desulfurase, partial [Bacteroidales bacterium]|nr:IscS subfamily cysteine desulfurase [Bacteroidales bacterium]
LTREGVFGNPASRSHVYGWQAEAAVEEARRQVAELVGADPREIVWTSGATESNNLAIKGYARAHRDRGLHIVTSAIEHKAVLDACGQLEREGFEVTRVAPAADGATSPEAIAEVIRDDTLLVSVMQVNNETGVINDIAAIGALCRERGVAFHADAAQSAGKIPIDLAALPVDLMSFSGHKIYGPKGIGALYVRRRPKVVLEALIHGGGHERGLRSGTLAVHQIVAMGEAFRLAGEEMAADTAHIEALAGRLWQGIRDLGGLSVNGGCARRVPGILNVAFAGVDGESLVIALKDLAVSTGSACTSASLEPSYVLRALGLADDLAHSSIRFSLGRFTSEADIDTAVASVRSGVSRLRQLSGGTADLSAAGV